jgi:hypothetical protein
MIAQDLWKRGVAADGGLQHPSAAFALRFLITSPGGREVEGEWSAEAVAAVLRHLDSEAQVCNSG